MTDVMCVSGLTKVVVEGMGGGGRGGKGGKRVKIVLVVDTSADRTVLGSKQLGA